MGKKSQITIATLPETKSSPLKIGRGPQKEAGSSSKNSIRCYVSLNEGNSHLSPSEFIHWPNWSGIPTHRSSLAWIYEVVAHNHNLSDSGKSHKNIWKNPHRTSRTDNSFQKNSYDTKAMFIFYVFDVFVICL